MTVTIDKADRQQLLRELLERRALRSQREVADALADEGVETTQATISRDLEELGAVKVRGVDGRLAYRLAVEPGIVNGGVHLAATIRQYVTSIASSGNLVVLRTPPACAHPVASAIDHAGMDEVLATVAGDDTVLVVAADDRPGSELAARFRTTLRGTDHQ